MIPLKPSFMRVKSNEEEGIGNTKVILRDLGDPQGARIKPTCRYSP